MKTISVRVNGSLVEKLGASRLTLQLPQEATVGDLVNELGQRRPETSDLLARAVAVTEGKHIELSTVLSDGQEVALLMPIAGGCGCKKWDVFVAAPASQVETGEVIDF